ncbi:MAG: SUMF1/EgtB/PvdO family nonheme iron enzyme [Planctomycetaceae bacterium]|nr:SUMF1/EgtB/PvdO family nonheme iron enzyme [Planctomycetaceae bacterium]
MTSSRRAGVTRIEAVVILSVAAIVVALASPLVLSSRESARLGRCQENLRQLGLALHAYHDAHGTLPPAAVWKPGPFESMALHQTKRIDLITHENWVMRLLPHLGRDDLVQQLDLDQPIAAVANEAARTAQLSEMICPSDNYNRPDNPHVFRPAPGREIRFARGNYAINGGTHCFKTGPGDTFFRHGDYAHIEMNREKREFRFWGNGVAGFNVCFSLDGFTNGTSTLVGLEEVRAGVHQLDPRGCWALGQIGASVTWGHGVNSDAYGPNNRWPRSDDLLGCGTLHKTVGSEFLEQESMPCVDYVDINQNATARSQHEGGANVLFLDGAIRFISDEIDPGLWHVMHSRETPREVLAENFETRLATKNVTRDADVLDSTVSAQKAEPLPAILNSLGMEFVLVPSGEFTMGLPDRAGGDVPPDVPAHDVRISRAYYLGRFEVTRGEYEKVIQNNSTRDESGNEATDLPVENVTWHEAQEFCRRLSELPAERTAGRRYRLPTEAEWEYACRAGSTNQYEWPAARSAGGETGEAAGAWPPLPITPIGSYSPNAFGLHDVRGNVWEWTADWFDRDYYARSPSTDPQGPAEGYLKVVRGGDWRFVGENCEIDYAMLPPWKGSPYVGFRLVCEAAHMSDTENHVAIENQ